MTSFQTYKQHDTMDCGPTCIRMVAKHYGKAVNIELLRNASQISKEGVSLLGIAEGAEKIGFNVKGVTLSYTELIKEAKLPAIIHWEQNHFVILYKAKGSSLLRRGDRLFVADPSKGIINYTKQQFCKHWVSTKDEISGETLGVALILEPTPDFYNQEDDTLRQAQSDRKLVGVGC